jgi:hypothetical protein
VVTLGTSITSDEIDNQQIVGEDLDSTDNTFIFGTAFRGTQTEADSQYMTKEYIDSIAAAVSGAPAISDSMYAAYGRPWVLMADDAWLGMGAARGRWVFDSSATDRIYSTGCNVGISDATPDNPLEVQSSTTPQFAIGYDDTYRTTFGVNASGDLTIAAKGKDISLSSITDTCDVQIIGNLLVGTSSKGAGDSTLHVYGGFAFLKGGEFREDSVRFWSDKNLVFGTLNQWGIFYDEATDDQLLFQTTNTTATADGDPLFEILVPASPDADQQVFGVAKGTQASNTELMTLDEDGDLVVAGTFSSAGYTPSGNITMPDDGWIGLGAAAGRIRYADDATDTVEVATAILKAGVSNFLTISTSSAAVIGDGLTVSAGAVALPNDQIQDTEIDWGVGAAQVDASDLPDFGTMTATDDNILVADGSDFESVAMSGDATMNNGVVTVADDSHAHIYSDIDATTSANWASQVSDETGYGVLVFNENPTIDTLTVTSGITVPANSISDDELDEGSAFAWTGTQDFSSVTHFLMMQAVDPTVDAVGELAWDANDNTAKGYDGTRSMAKFLAPELEHFHATIYNPDGVQADQDAVPILPVEIEWAPFGIMLVDLGIKTNASSSYSVNFEKWAAPGDGSPVTLETVATSASLEAEDDGTLSMSWVGVDSIVYVDLPTTDITMLTVWGTYIIVTGN